MRAARFLDGKRIELHDFVVVINVFGGIKFTMTGVVEILDIRKEIPGTGKDSDA